MSLCSSVCHKPVLCRNGGTDRDRYFDKTATLGLSDIVLEGNTGIFKNKGIPSGYDIIKVQFLAMLIKSNKSVYSSDCFYSCREAVLTWC